LKIENVMTMDDLCGVAMVLVIASFIVGRLNGK